MSQERERELIELFKYIEFYATNVSGIDPGNPIHPANEGKRIIAQFGRSRALEGFRQAVNDTVEELRDRSPEYVRRLDATLREHGVLTFSEIRRRYASAYRRILKQGVLRNETDYYVVIGILADVSLPLDDVERLKLNQLVAEYEARDA